jgi:hypothetical protein
MAKWIKIARENNKLLHGDIFLNAAQIRRIDIGGDYTVRIDGLIVAEFDVREKAEKWVADFIHKNYLYDDRI